MTITLKKREFGGYRTENGKFEVHNYMGVWTVIENIDGDEGDYTDFLTLAEAREFIANQITKENK